MEKNRTVMNKSKFNKIVDIAMVILMILLMAYSLIGELFHEAAGVVIFILFILHHHLHRNWWKGIFRGKYTPYRVFVTILNISLLFLMLAQPLSGIALARYIKIIPSFSGMASIARQVHMLLAYWCYVLMSIHLGLHIKAMTNKLIGKNDNKKVKKVALTLLPLLVSVYGVYAFVKRSFFDYMFMRVHFAFFDFNEPIIFFLADYVSIMVLFVMVGYYIGEALKHISKNK